jgi:hypothetical protein
MAQVPQDFNGMITFMNVKSEMAHQMSPEKEDNLKKTGGSLMRGTVISIESNHNSQGSGGNNNSIIMMRSESNTFGGDCGSPTST